MPGRFAIISGSALGLFSKKRKESSISENIVERRLSLAAVPIDANGVSDFLGRQLNYFGHPNYFGLEPSSSRSSRVLRRKFGSLHGVRVRPSLIKVSVLHASDTVAALKGNMRFPGDARKFQLVTLLFLSQQMIFGSHRTTERTRLVFVSWSGERHLQNSAVRYVCISAQKPFGCFLSVSSPNGPCHAVIFEI